MKAWRRKNGTAGVIAVLIISVPFLVVACAAWYALYGNDEKTVVSGCSEQRVESTQFWPVKIR